MISETEVANSALAYIGESQIYSIMDETKPARECRRHFYQVRDEVLSSARWRCSRRYVELSADSEKPIVKWDYSFELPNDFLRLCGIEGVDVFHGDPWFEIMGRKLMINGDDEGNVLCIDYVFSNPDVSSWDSLLCEAVAVKLASVIARSITGSDSKSNQLYEHYVKNVLSRAVTVDAQQTLSGENSPYRKMFRRSRTLRARM